MLIEDYAIVGDMQTVAVVGKDGSIDWLCLPRFDSHACFSALLGEPRHGRFRVAPRDEVVRAERRYRPDTLILETELTTRDGTVRIIDFMPPRDEVPDLVRIVEGVSGRVPMELELILRFGYGDIVPWVRRLDGRLLAVGGPDGVVLATPLATRGEGLTTRADFSIAAGERLPLVMTWFPSHRPVPRNVDAFDALVDTEAWWREWTGRCTHQGPYRDEIVRSLITLKALTYQPTGGILAAATTSLPECLGGDRNWDYRFCWLRDATFTLYAMLSAGFTAEAAAWRDWLLRAVAGDVARLQPMYGAAGERWIGERTLDWLPGYEGSRPVRIGNGAVHQLQLDVYGEVIDTMYQARRAGIELDAPAWALGRALVEWLEAHWREPDHGLWEVRGPRRHFTHSKVLAWVAMDRAVKAVQQYGDPGRAGRWAAARDAIHAEVCARAWDPELGSFVQSYGARIVDASLLLLPQLGFLPPEDPRIVGTIAAVERTLLDRGFVRRYPSLVDPAEPPHPIDGLRGREGAFLACTFWLVDSYVLQNRRDEARALFERLLAIRNDVGLLAEEYDVEHGRQVGNFPQAFSHVSLINSARNLATEVGPAAHRKGT